ncbi:hypothetical protein ACWC5O_31040 [Streptomyces sp. NPDC001450]
MFLRIVAIGPGCESHGGAAPTIELRAGTGVMATVPEAPAEVRIFDETSTQVGVSSWVREANDVFKVSVGHMKLGRSWRVRVSNNDREPLGFVWAASPVEKFTLQPRVFLQQREFTRSAPFGDAVPSVVVSVKNVGTGPLTISDEPKRDLGGGFTLESIEPPRVSPNTCASLTISAAAVTSGLSARDLTTDYAIGCDDLGNPQNRTVKLTRSGTAQPGPVTPKGHDKFTKDRKDTKDAKDDSIEKPGHPLELAGRDLLSDGSSTAAASLSDRLSALEEGVAQLVHFIRPELRPDVSPPADDQ